MMKVCAWLLPILAIASGFRSTVPPRPRLQVETITSTTIFAGRRGENETNAIFHPDTEHEGRRQTSALYSTAAVSSSSIDIATQEEEEVLDMSLAIPATKPEAWNTADYRSVLTTALLVTGNTVGAGTLVLPELVAQPGFATSSALFLGAYLVNLMSGLVLAEVAIRQHEQEPLAEPPSSFRDLANASFQDSPFAANGISAVALFVNTCAITFSLGRAGVILEDIAQQQIDHVAMSTLFGGLLVLMGATQSRVRISQISSAFVAALFASVAGLLLPAHVADPMGTLLAPGTALDPTLAMQQVAPILLTTLIFQNVVPPVTRILGYDRRKSVVAIVLGSFLPLVMYLWWSFVVLGGGVDGTVGLESPLMTLFSVAATTGSAIGCTMAVAEELETFLRTSSSSKEAVVSTQDDRDSGYGLPAFSMAVAVPLVCSLLCHEYTDALKLSGGYGIPILYGAIPVLLLHTQRSKLEEEEGDILPGGSATLALVGAAFLAFLVNSVVGDFL